jgi:hypothetical protein
VIADTASLSLAQKIGINSGKNLEATIASFNANAEKGEDPEFGRGGSRGACGCAAILFTSPTAISAAGQAAFLCSRAQANGRHRHSADGAAD